MRQRVKPCNFTSGAAAVLRRAHVTTMENGRENGSGFEKASVQAIALCRRVLVGSVQCVYVLVQPFRLF